MAWMMFRKLHADASSWSTGLAGVPRTTEVSRWDVFLSRYPDRRETPALRRLAADTAAPLRAIEFVDDVGTAVPVSLIG
jgi:hypothetical protein